MKVLAESEGDEWLSGGSTLVFCEECAVVERIAALVTKAMPTLCPGYLHEEMEEDARDATLALFKGSGGGGGSGGSGDAAEPPASPARPRPQLLVCTSLAARGLDIPGLRHVVLYDVPTDVTRFVHSAGRTARRGRPGVVTCLVRNANDVGRYKRLHALCDAPKLEFAQQGGGAAGGAAASADAANAGEGGGGTGDGVAVAVPAEAAAPHAAGILSFFGI